MKHVPTIVLTGASGLIGRRLLEEWKNDYRIFAVARRTQMECEAPVHPHIAWMRADISDEKHLGEVFREIGTAGGADFVFHLAAFYDFSGKNHPEYHTTNVLGTRNVLNFSQEIHPRLFVFASSIAACNYPPPGESIREETPPSGSHIYSWSKRQGENLTLAPENPMRSCVVRLGAVFTDWCEYPPLYSLLQTWLAGSWKSRILAGKGESAVPYIHMRDIITFFKRLIDVADSLPQKSILQACTNGSTSHRTMYQLATRHYFGEEKKPVCLPKAAIVPGLHLLRLVGKLTGTMPFEQPWMLRYIDCKLNVNALRTYDMLGWIPNARHALERRMPYLLEHMNAEPHLWHLKNMRAALKEREREELRIHTVIGAIEERVTGAVVHAIFHGGDAGRFTALRLLDENEVSWFVRMLYSLLLTSVHSGNKLLLSNYFEISSSGRFAAGYTADDLTAMLETLNKEVLRIASEWEDPRPSQQALHRFITRPIELAIDEIAFQRENLTTAAGQPVSAVELSPDDEARRQLEETIWTCLVMRK